MLRVEAMLVANRAAVDNWLLAAEGGGWEHATVAFFPATVTGYVAGVLALDVEDVGSTPAVSLHVSDHDGQVDEFRASMIVNGVRPATVQGVPCRVPFAIPFMTVARAPTVVKVLLADETGRELTSLAFAVRSSVPDAPPTA